MESVASKQDQTWKVNTGPNTALPLVASMHSDQVGKGIQVLESSASCRPRGQCSVWPVSQGPQLVEKQCKQQALLKLLNYHSASL